MNQPNLTPEQKWEQATLTNNFIFYRVMRDHPDACQQLIEMLLNIEIEKMEMHSEEVINTGELPERARYYSSLITLDSLKSGQKYGELCESHVIFLCLEDVFKNKLPICTFENICIEDGKTKLNDKDYKHFFYAPLCAKMIKDENVKSFFEFLISNHAKTNYTNNLKNYVMDAKLNLNYKRQFMEWERQRTYDFDAGKEAKAVEDARSFYSNGASIELIAKSLNMTIERVKEIVKDVEVSSEA